MKSGTPNLPPQVNDYLTPMKQKIEKVFTLEENRANKVQQGHTLALSSPQTNAQTQYEHLQ